MSRTISLALALTLCAAYAAAQDCKGCAKLCEKPEERSCAACRELCQKTPEKALSAMTDDQLLIQIRKYEQIQKIRESRIADCDNDLLRLEKDAKTLAKKCGVCGTPEGRRKYSDCDAVLAECEKGHAKIKADRARRQKELDKWLDETSDKPVLTSLAGPISLCAKGDAASCRPAAVGTVLACGQFLRTGPETRAQLRFKVSGTELWLRQHSDFMMDCSERRGRRVPSFTAVAGVRL